MRNLFLISLAIFAGFCSFSCKDDSVVFVCPTGTELSNEICCPPGTIGENKVCVMDEDSGVQFGKGDTHSSTAKDVTPANDLISDANPSPEEIFETSGAVGAPCMNDEHCSDESVCLSWPDGYCTFIGCTVTSCPAGSRCASTGSAAVCMESCESDEDCRSGDSYACKTIPSANGAPISVCHGVNEGAGDIGASCASNSECKGAGTCYTGLTGGMCVHDNCSVDSCPDGASCVMVDGAPRCLKNCNFPADCVASGFERTCEELATPPGDSASVCFVPQGAEPIGAQCTGGYACESSFCKIVAKGLCSFDASQGCASDYDCPDGQQCLVSTQNYRGVCSQPCDASGCPGSAACLGDENGDGWCLANCEGPSDPGCNTQIGTQCLFGTPEGSSVGKYYCAKSVHPGPMTSCAIDETCGIGGTCLMVEVDESANTGSDAQSSAPDPAGYCLTPCSSAGSCAFPGQCLPYGDAGNYYCMRPCNTSEECPENMACPMVQGNTRACLPPTE